VAAGQPSAAADSLVKIGTVHLFIIDSISYAYPQGEYKY
jgi:hypothetical protein